MHELVLFASLGLAGQLVELVESKPGGKAKFDYIFKGRYKAMTKFLASSWKARVSC